MMTRRVQSRKMVGAIITLILSLLSGLSWSSPVERAVTISKQIEHLQNLLKSDKTKKIEIGHFSRAETQLLQADAYRKWSLKAIERGDLESAENAVTKGIIAYKRALTALGEDIQIRDRKIGQAIKVSKELELLQQYIQSTSATQIDDGNNSEASDYLARAITSHDSAVALLEKGDLDKAQMQTRRGIRAYRAALSTFTTGSMPDKQLERKNQVLLAEIQSYHKAFNNALREKGPSVASLLDQRRVKELYHEAGVYTSMRQHRHAYEILRSAHQMVIRALTRIRDNETITYSRTFQTPAAEYRYERDRFLDYVKLARQLLGNKELSSKKSQRVQIFFKAGARLSISAKKQADVGNFKSAIKSMESANAKLGLGLQSLGLAVSR